MDREFRSAVDWWYYTIMIIVAGGCVATFLQSNMGYTVTALCILALVIHVFLNTWYVITATGELVAHCSFFPEKRINIREINAVEASSMPVSSYALSLDRIIIYKEDKPWMLISPRDKREFVGLLRKFNPAIEIRN